MTQHADRSTEPAAETVDRAAVRIGEAGWVPLIVVLAGTFVTFLDFFIVNVGLPAMQTELHAGTAALSLVVAGYGLTFAVGMITGGRLGDRYGRRRMFAIGLALFTVTSAACGVAPNVAALDVSRLLQGAAGALLTPQVLALIGVVYDGERRAKAFAAYGFAMGIAGVLGQLLGGALISADLWGLGWRLIFLINVPVGLATLACLRVVPESFGAPTRLDLAGASLLTAALFALVLPLVEGQANGWPAWTWLSLVGSVVCLVVFVGQQRVRKDAGRPTLVDLRLFAIRSFVAGSVVTLTFTVVPPSLFFVLAIYLQDGRGLSPIASGVVFGAVGAGYFAAMLLAGGVAARLGHGVLTVGALTVAGGCALLADAAREPLGLLVPGLAVAGAGIGFVLVPLASTVLAQVAPEQAGSGAGVLATTQQIGGALGVAVVSTIFFGRADVIDGFVTCMLVLAGITVLSGAATRLLRRG